MNTRKTEARNFAHLVKMVKHLMDNGDWHPLHPDSEEAKCVGQFLDLRENQIMRKAIEAEPDLFPVRDANGVRRMSYNEEVRYCFVDLNGRATIIKRESVAPRNLPYRKRLKLRLTRNEHKWASKFASRMRRGWKWDPWNHTVVDPTTLEEAEERELFNQIKGPVLADLFPELQSLKKATG